MMGLSFMELGHEVYLLFEKDFAVDTKGETTLTLYPYTGSFKEDGYYLEGIELKNPVEYTLNAKDILHMRIDPPYDSRYQRYLWMLDFLQTKIGLEVVNNPIGIMKHNEKLVAYKREKSLESYIGSSESGFLSFISRLRQQGIKELILKPLDLYSGIGVQKVGIDDKELLEVFKHKVQQFEGAIITQPFQEEVYQGEVRSIYLDGKEVGTILKKPVGGDFLANIAQGAQFESYELSADIKKECDELALELLKDGVRFIAYDILAGAITEVNVTCPGLLVEVSYAIKKNLAKVYATGFSPTP